MWQIAVAESLAAKHGDEVLYTSPEWRYSQFFEGDFTPQMVSNFAISKVWKEPHFHYTPIEYKPEMAIEGYFQSYKYLDEELIKSKFRIKETIRQELREKHKELLGKPNCSIHVRRGDYLTLPNHHPTITMSYIMKAVKLFPKDTVFLVFSDDPEWCKQSFPAQGKKFFVIEGQSDIEDLALQTMCDNNIIANSSYSWWGAYLNPNPEKKVVTPLKWFGEAYSHFDIKDMHPESWERI